jgi:hypothetical protein
MGERGASTGVWPLVLSGTNSWSALQIGPAMPVAWIDDLGANESIGFLL